MRTRDERAIAETFRDISRLLNDDTDPDAVYSRIVHAAARVLDACDHAAICEVRDGRFRSMAASDEMARRLDELQAATGEGPCLDAATTAGWEHHVDLSHLSTLNDFQRRLLSETSIRSVLAFRLVESGRKNGALNLAADRGGAFDETAAEHAAILASFASVAVAAAQARRRALELSDGLESNREIGVAMGILMSSYGVDRQEAFEVLRRSSQELNRKLRDVAREVTAAADRSGPNRPGGVKTSS